MQMKKLIVRYIVVLQIDHQFFLSHVNSNQFKYDETLRYDWFLNNDLQILIPWKIVSRQHCKIDDRKAEKYEWMTEILVDSIVSKMDHL